MKSVTNENLIRTVFFSTMCFQVFFEEELEKPYDKASEIGAWWILIRFYKIHVNYTAKS